MPASFASHPGASQRPRVLPAPLPAGAIDLAVQAIREAAVENLRDPAWLEHEFLPVLGLNDEVLAEFPAPLYPYCGFGVKSWQYPNQFSHYLCRLAARPAGSYVEIGVRHGGTFIITVEYLRRFFPLDEACAVDIEHSPQLAAYAASCPGIRYHIGSSDSPAAIALLRQRHWGIALIDGDHTAKACWSDYAALKDHTERMVLHDIVNDACPEIKQVWTIIRGIFPRQMRFEATDQYAEVRARTGKQYLGIGMIEFPAWD